MVGTDKAVFEEKILKAMAEAKCTPDEVLQILVYHATIISKKLSNVHQNPVELVRYLSEQVMKGRKF